MVTYAVTLSDLIQKGGAYAGLAAFFGLAVLSILYFAQAREIRRLRDWAGRAPERAQELEQRVVAQAEARRVQPTPSRKPGEPATAAAQRVAAPVAKPVAAAHPATAADAPTTVVPPVAEPAVAEAKESEAAPPAEPARVEAPAPAADEDSATEHEVVAASAAPEAEQEKEAVGAGATTALAGGPGPAPANGSPPETPSPSLPPRATQSPAVKRPAPAAAPLRKTPPATRRPGGPPPHSPLTTATGDAGGKRRTGVIAAGVIAGLAVIVVGLILIIGGGGSKPKPGSGTGNPVPTASATQPGPGKTAGPSNTASATSRANTRVAVLNGTTVAGLAGTVNSQLEQAGYTASQAPTNYTDQARSASVVFYNGSGNRTQAIEIAKLLNISDRQPIIDAAAQLAPGADVVIVVGADQTP